MSDKTKLAIVIVIVIALAVVVVLLNRPSPTAEYDAYMRDCMSGRTSRDNCALIWGQGKR